METIIFDGKEYILADFISRLPNESKSILFEALQADNIPYDSIEEVVRDNPRAQKLSDEDINKAVETVAGFLMEESCFDPDYHDLRNKVNFALEMLEDEFSKGE